MMMMEQVVRCVAAKQAKAPVVVAAAVAVSACLAVSQ